MVNPFEKRATEYLRDDEAFLAVVTPEPLITFFQKPAREDRLYDRLTTIIGTPGSGKTTLARLFQYSTVRTLLRNSGLATYRPIVDTLNQCGALVDGNPAIVGCRLPLEAEYRDFWEFPYKDELKFGLMMAMIQARVVLAWFRNLKFGGHDLIDIEVVPRADAEAAAMAVGGNDVAAIIERARQVELSIYRISAALIAPDVSSIDAEAIAAYRPLDVLESFRINDSGRILEMRPLVIFDDAHNLHPQQLSLLQRWLIRREIRVARWILMRMDALKPADVLTHSGDSTDLGIKRSREITEIRLQSGEERGNQRRAFRKMAKDMANRYLAQMEIFSRRGLGNLGDLLLNECPVISSGKLSQLANIVDATQSRYNITLDRRTDLQEEIKEYFVGSTGQDPPPDVSLAMLNILMERYAKRVPQATLFDTETNDPDPSRPLKADSGVADGAQIHLMHRFDRPYYYGIDSLCDASSENAEQFLQLASRLVSRAETQIIRAKNASLRADIQHQLLRERASEMMKQWDFPHHRHVRRLCDWIGTQCIEKSVEPNASLGGGANAIGILQEEFEDIPSKYPDLAVVLQFGVAYNIFSLVPNHGTKKQVWCLIELGGVPVLHYRLSLRRGGFLERRSIDLAKIINEA